MVWTDLTFDEWVRFNFDHPVTVPDAWYWDDDVDDWAGPPAVTVAYLTRLFENAADLLHSYSDAQVAQGFSYLITVEISDQLRAVFFDDTVPLADRVRCIQAIVPLFEYCFAPRCPQAEFGTDAPGRSLASVVYMWWDTFPTWGGDAESYAQQLEQTGTDAVGEARRWALQAYLDMVPPKSEDARALDAEVLDVIRRVLWLPSLACQESALHGLGHWEFGKPNAVQTIIDEFLAAHPDLPPRLRDYAMAARVGQVQ